MLSSLKSLRKTCNISIKGNAVSLGSSGMLNKII